MSTYKTTCPHCKASFKITTEQLGLRDGKARCGNCSQVFQASQFLSPIEEATPKQPTAQPAPPVNTQPLNTQERHDITPAGMMQSIRDDQLTDMDDLFSDNSLKRSVTKTQEIEIPDDALIDDSIDIPDDIPESDKAEAISSLGDELTAEFNSTQGNFSAITDAQLEDDAPNTTEDEWIEQLLSEDTVGSDVSYQSRAATEEQPEDLVSFLEDIGANTAQFSAIQPSQLTQEMQAAQANDPTSTNIPKARPLPQPRKSNALKGFGSFVMWAVLCCGLLATLAAQYLYFNFDQMARDINQRPQLEKVCGMVGCELPFMDSEKVGIAQVKRIKDDANPAWTRMSFVLTNQADKAMLLPNLQVTLKKKGNIVAENVITPADYLSGSYKRLPRSQPIDGNIRIKQALNSFDGYNITPLY